MPTPQSVDLLEEMLSGEVAWRKKEIVAFRSAAMRASASQGYYCRAGSVVLCAHWEGFLKRAVQVYVDHVFAQALPLENLADPFIAIYFYKDVMTASNARFPGSKGHHLKLARKIAASRTGPCARASWSVETEGNPSSEITAKILASVGLDERMGLDEAAWSVLKVFIDSQLLKDRHKVAHGERYPIAQDLFKNRSDRVILMCEQLATLILMAAGSRAYIRA